MPFWNALLVRFGSQTLDHIQVEAKEHYVDKKDKYPTTAPRRITHSILKFAEELGGEPQFVPHHPLPFSRPFQCFANCEIALGLGLGTPTLGWSIWSTRDLWLSAEYHCVLRTREGFLDITPIGRSGRVLFVPDGNEINERNIEKMIQELNSITSDQLGKYKLLVDHPLVAQAATEMERAAKALHRTGNTDFKAWRERLDKVDNLLDAYFVARNRLSRNETRAKRKVERQRRKKARHR